MSIKWISCLAQVTMMALELECCHVQHAVLTKYAGICYGGGSCKDYNESLWK